MRKWKNIFQIHDRGWLWIGHEETIVLGRGRKVTSYLSVKIYELRKYFLLRNINFVNPYWYYMGVDYIFLCVVLVFKIRNF